MRTSVLGSGNWHAALKSEQEFQRRQQEWREARIAQVATDNIGDPDFTFDTLCERFSESHPETIRRVLRQRCGVRVGFGPFGPLVWIR